MRLSSTKRTSKWLIGQLDDLKSQISQDQVALVALQGKLGVIGLNPQTSESLATQSLDSFTKAASAATVDRIVAEAKFRYLQELDPNLIEGEVMAHPRGKLRRFNQQPPLPETCAAHVRPRQRPMPTGVGDSGPSIPR